MRLALLALVSLAGGCVAERTAAWRDPRGGLPAQLVAQSVAARERGLELDGKAGVALSGEALALAERALACAEPVRSRALAGRPPSEVFQAATLDELPAVSAYAEALFAWSERRSFATLLANQDWIRAAASRAAELDRAFDHGAPDRLLGMLAASLPLDAGANLVGAMERFEAALAAAPRFLPTRVAYAERYAVRLRDGRLYRRLLEEVLAADPDALPDARDRNRAAQARARRLLSE